MGRIVGLLLFILAIGGCSHPTIIGTWKSGANPPAQFVVTIRSDGSYSMVGTTVGANNCVIRFDGGYMKTSEGWLRMDIHDANIIGGDPAVAAQMAKQIGDLTKSDGAGVIKAVDQNNAEMRMGDMDMNLARVTGNDIPPTLSAEEAAFSQKALAAKVVQAGPTTVRPLDVQGNPAQVPPVDQTAANQTPPTDQTPATTPTDQPADNQPPVDISTSRDPNPPADNSTGGTDQTGGAPQGDGNTKPDDNGTPPPDNNPPPNDNGGGTGDNSNSGGTTTG